MKGLTREKMNISVEYLEIQIVKNFMEKKVVQMTVF